MKHDKTDAPVKQRLPRGRIPLTALLSAAFLLLQAWQLQHSTDTTDLLSLKVSVIALNCGILLWLALGLRLLLQRWHLALYLSALLSTLWGVVNLYVLEFHGSPLFFSEFRSFGTAVDVLDGYTLRWTEAVTVQVLCCLGLSLLATGVLLLRRRGGKRFSWKALGVNAGVFAACTALLYACLFVWQTPKPRKSMGWSWLRGVKPYGYVSTIVEDVDRALNAYTKPEGYDPAHFAALTHTPDPEPAVKPDIILILNESFCDLHEVLDFTTDVDPLEAFYGLDHAVYGKAVVTSKAGHTNNTEYELLSSNSMTLLNVAAPFNYVNLSKTPHTLPRYLQRLGYSTAAMHCGNRENYSRNRVYPEMGFDVVRLGEECFRKQRYGKRPWLDADNYADLIEVYNAMDPGPRMLYLLTFQNHGGYESNDDSLDTVHVQEDFGDRTDDLNEYLTSVRMSAEAFRDLTEYYAAVDRPVMICMLGDHAAPLISSLDLDLPEDEAKQEVLLRTVPYVIWSNFDAGAVEAPEYQTLTDLMPAILRSAGLPLSEYYRALLRLHTEIPVRTLHGYYMDADGSCGRLEDHPAYADLQSIIELEYNGLVCGSDYREDLFLP